MVGLVHDITLQGENISAISDLRKKGRQSFLQQGLPTPKNENWKYIKVRELNTDDFVFLTQNSYDCVYKQPILDIETYEINFCNGKLVNHNLAISEGVEVMPLLQAIENKLTEKYLNQSFNMNNFPFAALNTTYLEQGLFIRVCENYQLDKPISLIYHTSTNEKILSNIHNVIVAEPNAKLEIIEYYHHTSNIKSQYFNNIINEFFVDKNASLNHYKVQNEAFKATHIALNCANIKENAKYESFCFQKGANLAQNETVVRLQEENASTCINSAYNINGWATVGTVTNIEHLHQSTYSKQLIKGVVDGNSKGVFKGKVHIAPNAVNTQGYQLHKAIILSDNSEVDVKPELEIFADDVKCSHGATCGELDKDQMFYLRSRGISEENAKQILIKAFIEEPFSSIDNLNIKTWLQSF